MTDYTDKDTFSHNLSQEYRLEKYLRDILRNWFCDSKNLPDQRLVRDMYIDGKLKQGILKVGNPFSPDGLFVDQTPSITISHGQITFTKTGLGPGGNPAFYNNKTQAPTQRVTLKTIPFNIVVVTEQYDATVLLAQVISLFLECNADMLVQDCTMLDAFHVAAITQVQPVAPAAEANAKQLYKSVITVNTMGYLGWATDTQGPVFQGMTITQNM